LRPKWCEFLLGEERQDNKQPGVVAGAASLPLKNGSNSDTVSPASGTAAYALTLPGTQGSAN
jgi:hypothetical protein